MLMVTFYTSIPLALVQLQEYHSLIKDYQLCHGWLQILVELCIMGRGKKKKEEKNNKNPRNSYFPLSPFDLSESSIILCAKPLYQTNEQILLKVIEYTWPWTGHIMARLYNV